MSEQTTETVKVDNVNPVLFAVLEGAFRSEVTDRHISIEVSQCIAKSSLRRSNLTPLKN